MMTIDWQATSLELFCGNLSPQTAQLYVRVSNAPGGKKWVLSGRVRGPHCRHAHTLSAQFGLVDLGAGPTLLARCKITDPCYWSPEIPALYRLSVDLREDGELVRTWDQEFGIRLLAPRGMSLFQEGRRTVLRGFEATGDPLSWSAYRAANAAVWMSHPSDEACRAAADEGVCMVASLTTNWIAEATRLARWASVVAVVCPEPLGLRQTDGSADHAPRDLAELKEQLPNTLLGVALSAEQVARKENQPGREQVDRWEHADLLAIDFPVGRKFNFEEAGQLASWRKPVLALRERTSPSTWQSARAACDDLQRDLAPELDCAGYFILGTFTS